MTVPADSPKIEFPFTIPDVEVKVYGVVPPIPLTKICPELSQFGSTLSTKIIPSASGSSISKLTV